MARNKHKLLITVEGVSEKDMGDVCDASCLIKKVHGEYGYWYDSASEAEKRKAAVMEKFPSAVCEIESPPEPEAVEEPPKPRQTKKATRKTTKKTEGE